jgi:hypothetical protein
VYFWDSSDPVSVDLCFAHNEVLNAIAEESKGELKCLDLRKVGGAKRPDVIPCVQVMLGGRLINTVTDISVEALSPQLAKVSYKYNVLRITAIDPILYTKGTIEAPRNYIKTNIEEIVSVVPPEAKAVLESWVST